MLCIIIDYFVAEENGCTAGTEQLAPQLAGGCWHPDNQRVVGTTVLRARVCQRQGIAPHSLEAVPAATPYATRAHLPTMPIAYVSCARAVTAGGSPTAGGAPRVSEGSSRQ